MTTLAQRSFAAGEIAPALYGRVDQVKYATGLRKCKNTLVMRHGGTANRAGSAFVGEVKDSTKTVRLIEFVFNAAQTYVLEFGDLYMRVIRDGAQVTEAAKTVTGVTNANPCVVTTSAAHGYATGEEVALSGILGAVGQFLNNRNFKVVVTAADKFSLQYMDGTAVNSTAFGAYTSAGSSARVYEIATPYLEAHLDDIRFVQSADVVTLVHPSYAPRELSRTGHTAWTLAAITFAPAQAGPTAIAMTIGGAGAVLQRYRVTAVAEETLEESLVGAYAVKATMTAATQANPCAVTTAAAHNLTTGDEVSIDGVLGMTQLNGQTVIVTVTGANTFTLNGVDSTAYTAYTSAGNVRRVGITAAAATAANPHVITWTAAADALEYNVYKAVNGVYGFLGVAVGTTFSDVGGTPDTEDTPPEARNPFDSADNYPSAVTYAQQRLFFGNTNNDTEKAWGSRTANFKNFTVSQPLQDDDAVTFRLAGRQVNAIQHLLEVGRLLVFTSGGEVVINGDADGAITPTTINARQQSNNGSSALRPLVVGGSALYVQARGAIVRDLDFNFQVDGYRGNDLSIFSAHLFDGFTLTDWAYQQIPHSIVWAVRSDGVLLGMTYVREHQVAGWHRHDLGGTVENVCAVPEGTEDALYVVVVRDVDGRERRYIERLASRQVADIVDAVFMDSSLSYDGRNTDLAHTMTLSGSGWTYTDTLTLTSSASYFTADDEGNEIHLTGADGTIIRCEITVYTNATTVSVRPDKTVPVAMQAAAITDWGRAVETVSGLWHLEGEDVSVFADGHVAACPNNETYDVVTIADGQAVIDRAAVVIHVGLPYVSDIETLDPDTAEGETISDKKKNVGRVNVFMESSRGMWAGAAVPEEEGLNTDDDPLYNLTELKVRGQADETYEEPVELLTGVGEVNIKGNWNSGGRVFIRQVDPLPISVLAVAPAGYFPFRG